MNGKKTRTRTDAKDRDSSSSSKTKPSTRSSEKGKDSPALLTNGLDSTIPEGRVLTNGKDDAPYERLAKKNAALTASLSEAESQSKRYLKHIERQEAQLAAVEEGKRHSEDQIHLLRDRLDACAMEVHKTRDERDSVRRVCDMMRSEVGMVKGQLDGVHEELEGKMREVRMLEGERKEALDKVKQLEDEVRMLRARLLYVEDDQELPAVNRSALVASPNQHLKKPLAPDAMVVPFSEVQQPEIAGSEMIHMLASLNKLVLDIASSAIKLPPRFRQNVQTSQSSLSNQMPKSPKTKSVFILDVLHPALVKHLSSPRQANATDTAWGMLAIGTVLQHLVAKYLETWPVAPSFETASSLAREFLKVYDDIRKEEPQASVTLWRKIGLKYIRPLQVATKTLHIEVVENTISTIADVLALSLLSGPATTRTTPFGSLPDSARTSMSSTVSQDQLIEHLQSVLVDKVRCLWDRADEFAERMKEHGGARMGEYRVMYIPPGTPYDTRRMRTLWEQPIITPSPSSPVAEPGSTSNFASYGNAMRGSRLPGRSSPAIRAAKVFCAPELGLEVRMVQHERTEAGTVKVDSGKKSKTPNGSREFGIPSIVLMKAGIVCCEPKT